MNGSQCTSEDELVCQVFQRAGDREVINKQENMELGNGVCLDRVEKFCYLGAVE